MARNAVRKRVGGARRMVILESHPAGLARTPVRFAKGDWDGGDSEESNPVVTPAASLQACGSKEGVFDAVVLWHR